jgi:hypothetical protein
MCRQEESASASADAWLPRDKKKARRDARRALQMRRFCLLLQKQHTFCRNMIAGAQLIQVYPGGQIGTVESDAVNPRRHYFPYRNRHLLTERVVDAECHH